MDIHSTRKVLIKTVDQCIVLPLQGWMANCCMPVVPKVCSADPLGSTTSSQRIRGCTSVMANMKFMYFFIEKNDVLLKKLRKFFSWWYVYFIWLLEYLIKKFPVPTKRVTVILIMVKSCNALLHMLLVCNSIYLNLVLKYMFLILGSHNLDTNLREQWGEDPWSFSEAEKVPRANKFGKHCHIWLTNSV